MSRNCSYCQKPLKNVEEYIVMHDKCFERYKTEDKTPDSYILMMGKYKGLRFSDVEKKHKKYIEWCLGQDAEDDSPMHFFQTYVKKFRKEEEEAKNKDKKKKKKQPEHRKSSESDSDIEISKPKKEKEKVDSESEDDL